MSAAAPTPAPPPPRVAGLPAPGRCLVMGVLNVTPDSFSDGGLWFEPEQAVEHGLAMLEAGADLVDVGGESTRPGARRLPADDELSRVLPVVRSLADAGAVVSIDTMRADVVERAVDSGARLVNDVSGGLADERMLAAVAATGLPFVAMHWRAHSQQMDQRTQYAEVVADVVEELRRRVDAALAAGIEPDRLVVDPGLGFAKTGEHNWALLANLGRLQALGLPVLVGASRKRFLGALLPDPVTGAPREALGRDSASAAVSTLAAAAGAWCVRVHEVGPSADAVRVVGRWQEEPHV